MGYGGQQSLDASSGIKFAAGEHNKPQEKSLQQKHPPTGNLFPQKDTPGEIL